MIPSVSTYLIISPDILRKIMSFCLVTEKEVTPISVACNCMAYFQEPSYSIGITGIGQKYQELCEIEGVDHFYQINKKETRKNKKKKKKFIDMKYSGYFKKPIDATILRVCRLFHQEGLPLLYGDNEFVFDVEYYLHREKPCLRMNVEGETIEKNWTMPRFSELDSEAVQASIRDMTNITDAEALPDWIYLDP